jgi:hypothetical protein
VYLFGFAFGNASRRDVPAALGGAAIVGLGLLRTIADAWCTDATASSSALLKIVAPGVA